MNFPSWCLPHSRLDKFKDPGRYRNSARYPAFPPLAPDHISAPVTMAVFGGLLMVAYPEIVLSLENFHSPVA